MPEMAQVYNRCQSLSMGGKFNQRFRYFRWFPAVLMEVSVR